MISTLPSGEGTTGDAQPDSALEPDSAPTTGLEPDTALDAAGEQDANSAGTGSGEEPRRRVLGDPALDNEQEMQQAEADLQSSREKSSTARDISDRLTVATRPETAEGRRS